MSSAEAGQTSSPMRRSRSLEPNRPGTTITGGCSVFLSLIWYRRLKSGRITSVQAASDREIRKETRKDFMGTRSTHQPSVILVSAVKRGIALRKRETRE